MSISDWHVIFITIPMFSLSPLFYSFSYYHCHMDQVFRYSCSIEIVGQKTFMWEVESPEFLFIKCERAQEIWRICYSWIGISTTPESVSMHFWQHHLCSGNVENCLVWVMWKHRIKNIFEGKEICRDGIIQDVLNYSWLWLKLINTTFMHSFV